MVTDATIERKLKASTAKVNRCINDLLEPRRPEVLYEAAKHIIASGGKRLRPYLVLKSCELVGGDPDSAVPFAAAMEVLHNFTLIHDDIMDGDDLRRGVPTVHKLWGIPIGIASGDLLFTKVYQAMVEQATKGVLPCDRVITCIERVTDANIAICEGQVLDISFPSVVDVTEDDYLTMVGEKTSALFKACAEIGAIAGGGAPDEVVKLGSFAWDAGIAFQIIDDILGVIGDEETLGKPVGSDLREGKKTLIVIRALKCASPIERQAIERVLGVEGAMTSDIEAANKVLKSTGGIDYARAKAWEYADMAEATLSLFPESQAKRDLLELVDYFVKRNY
jgi:geranylgeranyl diphosphate synthase type I